MASLKCSTSMDFQLQGSHPHIAMTDVEILLKDGRFQSKSAKISETSILSFEESSC